MLVITDDNENLQQHTLYQACSLAHLPKIISDAKILRLLSWKNLKFRDFLTVAIVVDLKDSFPDNWIYILIQM